jgi:glycosyltransferase involved in cell wall biosynthesis
MVLSQKRIAEMNSEIKSGIAISVAGFIWLLLEFYLGFHTIRIDYYPFFTWMSIVIPIIGLYWAIKAKRDRFYKGEITFIKAAKTGLIITAVSSIISPLLSWFYVSVVNPFYFSSMLSHSKKIIEELNLTSIEEKTLKINETYQYYNTSSYLLQTFSLVAISGIALSLIIAALIKKSKNQNLEKTLHKS